MPRPMNSRAQDSFEHSRQAALPRGHVTGWGAWGRFAAWMVGNPWVVWALVAINLSSAVAGYIYWYGNDIVSAPPYRWPFVPDSPLSATLWAVALVAFHYGRRWQLLGLLAVTGAIKYGLWTDWVWFTNRLSGGGYNLEAVVLSLNHLGMVLEGIVLVPLLVPRIYQVFVVAAWYGLNDIFDYLLGERPRVPNPEDLGVITAFALGSTVVLCASWLFLSLRRVRSQ